MQLQQPDSWLLSRLSPNSTVQNVAAGQQSQFNQQDQRERAVIETETDSGLDSLEESIENKDKMIEVEEMQEVKLNIRGGKCYNMTSRTGNIRPKIPTRLCKVTRV